MFLSSRFPGRQYVVVSNKWGFTNFTYLEYAQLKVENRLISKGNHVNVNNGHGPLERDASKIPYVLRA